jgi:hypothetical protein
MIKNDRVIEYLDKMMPSPSQFDHLEKQIKFSINLRKHFEVDDEELWGNDEKDGLLRPRITIRQYRYILALMFSKDFFKLNEIMLQLGFKPKKVVDTKEKFETNPF